MMTQIQFTALPTEIVTAYQNGAKDANGQTAEQAISDGDGIPCRHCLKHVAAGEPYLILAHRPFPELQPYAELGPIFLHAKACSRYAASRNLPPILGSKQYIIRGYNKQNRIMYGTGQVTATTDIPQTAAQILSNPDIAYIHVRSAANNCFQCRIDRRE